MYVRSQRYPRSKWGVGRSPKNFELVVWLNVWRYCIWAGVGSYD